MKMSDKKSTKIEDVLTEQQLQDIASRCVAGQVVGRVLRPASEGLGGFLGDHFRLTLEVQADDQRRTLPLFVKRVPLHNEGKLAFVRENAFFEREMTVFKLLEDMETGPTPWAPKALFYSDSVLVMPDLAPEGYSVRDHLQTFDLPHIMATLTSVARFHAGCANLETNRGLALKRPYSIMEDQGKIIVESNFQDTPWIHAAAKLTTNIIRKFTKYNFEETDVLKQFLASFNDPAESKGLNVIIHKDLWVNNIMFKYENDVPINAILLDFQCARYGPPAFDIAVLLYTTTSRSFREKHEDAILRHYFKIFTESLNVDTKVRLKDLGYDYEEFLRWFEISRRFGMVVTLILFPYFLMDPVTAHAVFNNPLTFERVAFEDRTPEVLAHIERCPQYGERMVEVTEEFVERCLRH
ncbi:uncharacterized protein LOC133524512 [Cydia pomonella]|uniref:uncharacterized protein LOC133524512 n=1 Tax=Cydia pomonella TaxID=82600 RepID=UPI002ADD7B89|nr:uncharacterized protein LOC133524512 [Cydia pomonella]